MFIIDFFPKLVFIFSVVQVLVGLSREFCKHHVFSTRASVTNFNNIIFESHFGHVSIQTVIK